VLNRGGHLGPPGPGLASKGICVPAPMHSRTPAHRHALTLPVGTRDNAPNEESRTPAHRASRRVCTTKSRRNNCSCQGPGAPPQPRGAAHHRSRPTVVTHPVDDLIPMPDLFPVTKCCTQILPPASAALEEAEEAAPSRAYAFDAGSQSALDADGVGIAQWHVVQGF